MTIRTDDELMKTAMGQRILLKRAKREGLTQRETAYLMGIEAVTVAIVERLAMEKIRQCLKRTLCG